MFLDEDVTDGIEYTYSVVAYDMGVEPTYVKSYKSIGNGQFETVIDTNFSNPNEWANPEGYASIENSKGTTILDRNFVQVYPGVKPQNNLDNVNVVPNPYKVRSKFLESEFERRVRFTNLPQKCKISIFSLSGELIFEINHNNQLSGNEWWDLRTINNQEIAPGLYLYHIQNIDLYSGNALDEAVGKFAVIR